MIGGMVAVTTLIAPHQTQMVAVTTLIAPHQTLWPHLCEEDP